MCLINLIFLSFLIFLPPTFMKKICMIFVPPCFFSGRKGCVQAFMEWTPLGIRSLSDYLRAGLTQCEYQVSTVQVSRSTHNELHRTSTVHDFITMQLDTWTTPPAGHFGILVFEQTLNFSSRVECGRVSLNKRLVCAFCHNF